MHFVCMCMRNMYMCVYRKKERFNTVSKYSMLMLSSGTIDYLTKTSVQIKGFIFSNC